MTDERRRLTGAATLFCLIAASLVVLAPGATAEPKEKKYEPRDSITIESDKDFDAEHGIVGGNGSHHNPYLISGWQVHHLEIADTGKAVTIRDNSIGQLILNWNGPNVTVVDNSINDLRVNQNVERTGAATSGLIARNRFGVVGQLRHFDGVFRNNTVGQPARDEGFDVPFFSSTGSSRAVNFDGFNGSVFRDNVLYGYLEVRLHGHHHGSGYGATSHQHSAGKHTMDAPGTDHTKRYHRVTVKDNTIQAYGPYALIYTDSNHAGNDRTAASEENEALNAPHKHWTKVHLLNNRLIGSGIAVDIFNADDSHHTGTERGSMHIANNDITMQGEDLDDPFGVSRYGIQVWNARDVELRISGNRIVSEIEEDAATSMWKRTSGIFLEEMDLSDVYVSGNQVANTYYGVSARYFTPTVKWWVKDLNTKNVDEAVHYDESVSNPPRRGS